MFAGQTVSLRIDRVLTDLLSNPDHILAEPVVISNAFRLVYACFADSSFQQSFHQALAELLTAKARVFLRKPQEDTVAHSKAYLL